MGHWKAVIKGQDTGNLLTELDPQEALGVVGISPFVLSKCAETIDGPLGVLRLSRREVLCVPIEWRMCQVPFFMKDDRGVALNNI